MQQARKSPTAVHTRAATEKDAALISALAHRIWPACYENILLPEHITNLLARIYSVQNLASEMQQGQRFWIASVDGEDAAFGSAYKEGSTVWIKKLYVDPAFQGKGIGTQLMDEAARAFAPVSEMRLLVNRNNTPAMDFYTRNGFARIAEVPVQMGDFHFMDFMYSRPIEGINYTQSSSGIG